MSDILAPRDYQQECINAVAAAKFRGVQRPVVVLPTGAGKTIVFSHLSKLFREAFPVKKVVILAHTDELVRQAARKVKDVAPRLKVGVVMADRHEVWAEVIVASVQSMCRDRRLADIKGVGLIIIDECHHATAASYRKILRHYGALPPEDDEQTGNGPGDVFVVGFTATLKRSDRAALNQVWQEVVFTKDIAWMIEQGYLVRPRGISVEVPDLKLSDVRRSGGDYQQKALASAVVKSMAPEIVAEKYLEHAADRPGVMFWPSVEAAYLGAQSMIERGFSTAVIEGDMPREERRLALKKAEQGDVQVLSSCMVLTEGFDNPRMSCAVIARPTDSAPLYQQMVGRVLRPHAESGKVDALVLDVVGAGKQHTLEALIDLEDKTRRVAREDEELDEDDRPVGDGAIVDVIPHSGETISLEFDPLAKASPHVWLTTRSGARFLRAGVDYYLFLAPGVIEGNWTVAWCRKVPRADTKTYRVAPQDNAGITEHAELPLDTAMRWAEQIVTETFGRDESHKRAGWRDEFASASLLARARRLKIPGPSGGSRRASYWRLGSAKVGEVEDAIAEHQASARIDPIIEQLKGS